MTASHLPGHAEQPEEIVCPSCGRFVGALPKCPHCGARVATRMSIRLFRYAALVLATAGLGLLYLMATHRDIPIIEIGAIKPTMNFAYVRVAGRVTGDTRITREGGTVRGVRFTVDDGTGEIPVTAFRAKGQELVDLIPQVGDHVEVTGSLSVSAERMALWLQAPNQLKIERAEIVHKDLGAITDDDLGRTVQVEGQITAVHPPRQGSRRPWNIVIKDATGRQELNFWQDTYDAMEYKTRLAPGRKVRATVAVGSFRGRIQLRLGKAEDLEFLDETAGAPAPKTGARAKAGPRKSSGSYPPTPLAKVTEDKSGKYVKVAGEVLSVTPPQEDRAPYVVVLSDGEAQVPVVYWNGVATRLKDQAPVVGAHWQVTGRVNVYSNTVQVKVNRAETARLLADTKE